MSPGERPCTSSGSGSCSGGGGVASTSCHSSKVPSYPRSRASRNWRKAAVVSSSSGTASASSPPARCRSLRTVCFKAAYTGKAPHHHPHRPAQAEIGCNLFLQKRTVRFMLVTHPQDRLDPTWQHADKITTLPGVRGPHPDVCCGQAPFLKALTPQGCFSSMWDAQYSAVCIPRPPTVNEHRSVCCSGAGCRFAAVYSKVSWLLRDNEIERNIDSAAAPSESLAGLSG